jgi:hypothetical protein
LFGCERAYIIYMDIYPSSVKCNTSIHTHIIVTNKKKLRILQLTTHFVEEDVYLYGYCKQFIAVVGKLYDLKRYFQCLLSRCNYFVLG